jgi:hypothetical protein
MRVTIHLPNSSHRRLKAEADRRGCSTEDLILSILQRAAGVPEACSSRKKGRIRLPLIHSKQPGMLTSEEVYKALAFP